MVHLGYIALARALIAGKVAARLRQQPELNGADRAGLFWRMIDRAMWNRVYL